MLIPLGEDGKKKTPIKKKIKNGKKTKVVFKALLITRPILDSSN